MEAIQTIRESLSISELLNGLGLVLTLRRLFASFSGQGSNPSNSSSSLSLRTEIVTTTGLFILFLAAKCWLALVNTYVPEPYLDEVFHIPQAQTYCEGRFWDWDDKITTPPGLYLLSVAYRKLWMPDCNTSSLRSNNLLATLLTAGFASQCRHLIEVRAAERERKPVPRSPSFYSFHTGLNIALVPVIFFFSALYYTDVLSTLVVLVAYRNHLLRLGPKPPSLLNDLWTVVLGVAALSMRQTNVFWVVVYMGGLEAVHVLPIQEGFSKLHDPPLNQSVPEDWVFCAITVAVTTLCNPLRVVRQIWPHITILVLFAGFVAWNGGVVLGDKSNHIATIHLPQMLYIWPLFAFFSAPLLLPSVLSALTRPIQYLRSLLSLTSGRTAVVSIPYTLLTILLSLAVVKYNTIIHPFTLADNRHYMFYIFRYTILRSPTTRLSLVAAYTICRWVVWDQLAGISHNNTTATNSPSPPPPKPTTSTTTKTNPNYENDDPLPLLTNPTSALASSTPPRTSTALLWLLTTSLSLITAPLVEPRYFILPWVFYRLLVPAWFAPLPPPSASGSSVSGEGEGVGAWVWRVVTIGGRIDPRLVLETTWFVVVNGGTMYMFLFRRFYWRGEDGGLLDGGGVQRFMW